MTRWKSGLFMNQVSFFGGLSAIEATQPRNQEQAKNLRADLISKSRERM
jgi:hypothetical protein